MSRLKGTSKSMLACTSSLTAGKCCYCSSLEFACTADTAAPVGNSSVDIVGTAGTAGTANTVAGTALKHSTNRTNIVRRHSDSAGP